MTSVTRYFKTEFNTLHINRQELYLLMGYGEHTPNQEILDIITETIDEISGLCEPYYGYCLSEGEIIDKTQIRIGDNLLSPGRIIATALRGSTHFALFTSTIGHQFDEWLEKQKTDDEIVKLFIGNTLGSVLAESVVDKLKEQLEQDMAKENLLITNNYSPGYCDWALTEQRILFSILPTTTSKISLTDSCLMLPIKSVSGIIGVGENVRKRAYHCDICKMENCIKRQKSNKN